MDNISSFTVNNCDILFFENCGSKVKITFSSSEAANRARAVILGALSKKAVMLELDDDGKGRIYE